MIIHHSNELIVVLDPSLFLLKDGKKVLKIDQECGSTIFLLELEVYFSLISRASYSTRVLVYFIIFFLFLITIYYIREIIFLNKITLEVLSVTSSTTDVRLYPSPVSGVILADA